MKCSIENCEKIAEKRGWCGMHYRRWQRHGTTDLILVQRYLPSVERFWEKVNKDGPVHAIHGQCWLWTGCTNDGDKGYGLLDVNGKTMYVHRFSYEIHYNKPDEGLFVCHHCDNKQCVNPDHLFLGTLQDNTDDKVKKNRQLKGEDIVNSKLTENDVLLIRQLYRRGKRGRSLTALANRFGVCMQLVSQIINRKIWRHI